MASILKDSMPLYPSETQIARAVLGTERSKAWNGLATVLERHGFPKIDPQFGGRYWPAVKAYLDRRHGLNGLTTIPQTDDEQENWGEPVRKTRSIRARA